MSWVESLGLITMLFGMFFVVVAAVGVFRMPDVYCRSHALAKALTLGIMLLLVGYGLSVPEASWFKLFVALTFQFVTIPVASHLFCLTAYRKGVKWWTAPHMRGSPSPTEG